MEKNLHFYPKKNPTTAEYPYQFLGWKKPFVTCLAVVSPKEMNWTHFPRSSDEGIKQPAGTRPQADRCENPPSPASRSSNDTEVRSLSVNLLGISAFHKTLDPFLTRPRS